MDIITSATDKGLAIFFLWPPFFSARLCVWERVFGVMRSDGTWRSWSSRRPTPSAPAQKVWPLQVLISNSVFLDHKQHERIEQIDLVSFILSAFSNPLSKLNDHPVYHVHSYTFTYILVIEYHGIVHIYLTLEFNPKRLSDLGHSW